MSDMFKRFVGILIFATLANIYFSVDCVMAKESVKPPVSVSPGTTSGEGEQLKMISTLRISHKGDRYEAGKSTLMYKDITLYTDTLVVTGKDDKLVGLFKGAVKVVQPNLSLTCSSLEMYFKQERGLATGNVIILKDEDRKDDKGKVKRVKTTIKCDSAEFLTAKKDFSATGSVYIEDGDVKAWASKAIYSESDKKLILSGKVKINKADGSKVNAENIIYYTQTENLEVIGNAEVVTFIK